MNISVLRIIEASVDILNADGIEGLTMRKIADRLQVAAASLYFHVKDKKELYGLITEHICKSILCQIRQEDTLKSICFTVRKEFGKVKDVSQLFVVAPPVTEGRIALINLIFGKLKELGVEKNYLAVAGNLLNNYILSFVTDESAWSGGEDTSADIPFDIGITDIDKQFEFGLQVIFTGLEASKKS